MNNGWKKTALTIGEELPMELRPKIRYWLPAAAVDEDDLRAELCELCARGFGGVEIVVLSTLPEVLAKGEDGWGTEKWNNIIAVIADETEKLGMSMDIANGPGWPISMPTISSAEDKAALRELTYGVTAIEPGQHYTGALPGKRVHHQEGKATLLHALAYRETADKVLAQDSYLDLMPHIRQEGEKYLIDYEFPNIKGCWKLFAFYLQPAVNKTNAGQCYVIDHISTAGVKACEEYWDSVFARHNLSSMESFFCDSLEYQVSLEWTPGLEDEFCKRRGYSLLPFLPFIGLDNMFPPCDIPGYRLADSHISDMINRDYLETLTQLYCENHLAVLEKMAQKYGKSVRYQVAYNRPYEVERSALYISIPENEALGRPAIDSLKTMAAAVHLGRKQRYSFECAAEFGHSYGQDYENLFWWVKRSLMAGMNAQVLHGASYSGRYGGKYSENGNLPGVQWPGYEGFGKLVSNYWNRTLSQSHAKGCMDAITRLNTIFQKKPVVDCAIYRSVYGNDGLGSEFYLFDDKGGLANSGYSYEFISEFMLMLPQCKISNNVLDEDGAAYKVLIVPENQYPSAEFLLKVTEFIENGFPVVWIGAKPLTARFYSEWNSREKIANWQNLINKVWELPFLSHVDSIEEVPLKLSEIGVTPAVWLPESGMDVMTAMRTEGEKCYFALYGYNRVEYSPMSPNPDELAVSALFQKGTTKSSYQRPGHISRKRLKVRLSGKGVVYHYNYWSGKKVPMNFHYDSCNSAMTGWVELEEDELMLLLMEPGTITETGIDETTAGAVSKTEITQNHPVEFNRLELTAFKPETVGETSFLRSRFKEETVSLSVERLRPWHELDQSLLHFAGKGVYYGTISITKLCKDCRYILHLGNVSDTFSIRVNGEETDFPDQVLKCVDISNQLTSGENSLTVTVVSNLYNCLLSGVMPTPSETVKFVPRNYGIWESEHKKIWLETVE